MAQLVGIRGQQTQDYTYDASSTITTGGTAQLVLARSVQRSFLLLQNISDTAMYFEFGSARATATLTSGGVSSCSVTNAGQGFSLAPIITFIGGGNQSNGAFLGGAQPGYPAPSRIARAHCVMTGTVPTQTVNSIVIDDPGAGYVTAPYVFLQNNINDPNGVAAPSATSGVELVSGGGSLLFNGTSCPTDQISVYCATTGKAYTCKWMA